MKAFLTLLFVAASITCFSQVEVNKNNVKDHIGDSVKYCGQVTTARLMDRMTNAPVFLNIDGAYPGQVLTVVIWKGDRFKFQNSPEQFYTGQTVCIYGKLEKYKDQLQIVIHSPEQLIVQEK